MAARFLAELFTPEVLAEQERFTSRSAPRPPATEGDVLGPDEAAFIGERDSFYMATVSSSGWPYVQHRGGPRGFIHVLDERTLAFADYKGNRQLISTGNLVGDGRVALILVDYPARTRLKILGRASVVDARDHRALPSAFDGLETGRKVERVVSIAVVGFDWNCPAYITQRFTVADIEGLVAPMKRRIAELEAELLRARPHQRAAGGD